MCKMKLDSLETRHERVISAGVLIVSQNFNGNKHKRDIGESFLIKQLYPALNVQYF